MAEAVFSMGQVAKSLTLKVRVKGVRLFQFRLRVAIAIIKVAAWVAGMPVEVDVSDET